MHRALRQIAAIVSVVFFSASAAAATAPHADPEAAKRSIREAAEKGGVPLYERKLANGDTRLMLNANEWGHVEALTTELGRGSDILEITEYRGAPHTQAIFDRQLLHTQFKTGTNNWRLRRWGQSLELEEDTLYSAMIHLTPSEAQRLRGLLVAAWAEQGPSGPAVGKNWETGHLNQALGKRQLNCVSTWTEMPLGEHGEPLWQLLGLPQSYSGNPHGLQAALETQGNQKVLGTIVYGERIPEFGKDPNARVVQ